MEELELTSLDGGTLSIHEIDIPIVDTLVGKKVWFYGTSFAGNINQKGIVVEVSPSPFDEKSSCDVKLDNGFSYKMGNGDIQKLVSQGILPKSTMLIGDPMEIKIIG